MLPASTILSLVLILSLALGMGCQGEELEFECIDTLEDLEGSSWLVANETLLNAEAPSDIAAISGTNLTGKGIMYFEGPLDDARILTNESDVSDLGPAFIYFKYYGNFETNIFRNAAAFVPVLEAEWSFFLMTKEDDTWAEILFEINLPQALVNGLDLIVYMQDSKLFLIDKIIVARGQPIMDMAEIKKLCP